METKEMSKIAVVCISYIDNRIMELEYEDIHKRNLHDMGVSMVMRTISELIEAEEQQRSNILREWFKRALTEERIQYLRFLDKHSK